jgi:hypothetical protein
VPGQPPGGFAPAAAPPTDATALLRLILGTPQLHQALQSAAVLGGAGPRTMELPLPAYGAPGAMRTVSLPVGSVANLIASLAGRVAEEMNAHTSESDPELPDFLVNDQGQLIVDPADAGQRAALVAHTIRTSQAAVRSGWFGQPAEPIPAPAPSGGRGEADEAWAREAGFFD